MSRRAFLMGATGGAALLLGGGNARAAPAALPEIVDCAGWGARPASAPIATLDRRPTRIIVHHTADPNGRDVSRDAAVRLARAIQNHHMDRQGWIDSGQQFTITRGGIVLEGRHRSLEALQSGKFHVVGAHCTGQNDVAVGIENEGIYTSAIPPRPQLDRLREMLAALCTRYGIAPAEIRGHREYRDTACPGDQLYGLLPQLRTDVGTLVGRPLAAAQALQHVWPLLSPGDRGPAVAAAQHLLSGAGHRVEPSGKFDPGTEQAVLTFQTEHATEGRTGLIGGETWPLLTRDVRVDRGPGEQALRCMLGSAPGPHAVAIAGVSGGPVAVAGGVLDDRAWKRVLGELG
ncbi:peptidoglycan recognition protein family protein [Pseudonocardia sp.]|uniref:peptidoglycan recognition protein family protein n=1 Tax=Pseudonocardia sp. TaxID=60912 RepID=UPI003D0BC7EC